VPDFPILLLVMALAALTCRMAGFVLMRLMPGSPRIGAALRATPLSVMAGITALAFASGGIAEGLALAGVIALTFLLGSDVAAALLGVALVAVLRWIGI
jgi:uncharacterized membrane protein